jgi:hypothetical protein
VVLDNNSDRRANSLRMTHAGDDLYGVGLDPHAAAAAIALLAPPQLAIYFLQGNRDPRGKPGEGSNQAFAVRFACGLKTKHSENFQSRTVRLRRCLLG